MLTVRDVMVPEPLTVQPQDSLRAAADALISAGVGGAPVAAGGVVVGLLSLTDVVAFTVDDPGVPTFRSDMAPVAGEPEELELEEPGSSWFVEMWDDAGADVVSRLDEPEGPEWDPLDEHTVSEVMTRRVLSVGPDAPLDEAARAMIGARVHRLVVVRDGFVVGILCATDIVRAVGRGLLVPAEAAALAGA